MALIGLPRGPTAPGHAETLEGQTLPTFKTAGLLRTPGHSKCRKVIEIQMA